MKIEDSVSVIKQSRGYFSNYPVYAHVIDPKTQVYNVKSYGALGDGITDDLKAIQNAINDASEAGGGTVVVPASTYIVSGRIVPQSNVTLLGTPGTSVLKINKNDYIVRTTSSSFHDFTIDGLIFEGSVNQFPTSPTRTRTTSGPGCVTAVYITGDGDPFVIGAKPVSNFTMRNCIVRNCTALPIRVSGLTGTVRVTNCDFVNNQDPGFIFNEEVIFNNNHSMMGADNGVSLSRGNRKVTCVGNTFENIAFHGIFIAGFDINNDADPRNVGPTNFTVTGNTIKNCGYNCIYADSAPKTGVISGNVMQQGYFRGPIGANPTDINSVGIYIAGYPFPYSTPSEYAENIQVTGNTIYQCGRAGVEVFAAKRINIDSNLIIDTGTQFKADGATAVAPNDVTSNVGVLIHTSNCSDVSIRNNTIIDSRGSAFCNYGVVPFSSIPITFECINNRMSNCRNSYNLIDYSSNDRVFQGGASIIAAKGFNDAHNNRVLTITDNPATAPNFLNVQGGVSGQAVAIAAESFSESVVPIVIRSRGAAPVILRPGADSITAIQLRKADGTLLVNLDSLNGYVGIGTVTPAYSLDVAGTLRVKTLLGASANPPSIIAGTGAGNSPTVIITGSDTAGKIAITVGATPSSSAVVASILFGNAFPNPPALSLTASNNLASALSGSFRVYPISSIGGFTLNVGSSALVSGAQYTWDYITIG